MQSIAHPLYIQIYYTLYNKEKIDEILITINKDNLASQAVARANGGVLTDEKDDRVRV